MKRGRLSVSGLCSLPYLVAALLLPLVFPAALGLNTIDRLGSHAMSLLSLLMMNRTSADELMIRRWNQSIISILAVVNELHHSA